MRPSKKEGNICYLLLRRTLRNAIELRVFSEVYSRTVPIQVYTTYTYVYACTAEASGKDFSNSSENIKSKLSREQENSGWKRKKKHKREGEKWGRMCVCVCVCARARRAAMDETETCRETKRGCVCTRACVHTWDGLLNKLTLKKWAADSSKGVAWNHKSLRWNLDKFLEKQFNFIACYEN